MIEKMEIYELQNIKKFKHCPNCAKKGLHKSKKCFIKDKTHKCKYCDMEFELKINKGELVWVGDTPSFS